MHRIGFLIPVLLLLFSCRNQAVESKEKPLLKVYNDYLYPSEIKGMLSTTLTAADSEKVVRSYIDSWIKERVLAHKAELNLTEEEKDVQGKLDEYRRSLVIYRYQMKLVAERVDTLVTDAQLKDYYEKNKNNFELKKNLVQLSFVKIIETSPLIGQVKNIFRSSRLDDKQKLSNLCARSANNYFLDDEVWLDFNEVIKELPIKNYDQEEFLKNNKFLEIKEGNYLYLINIRAYRIKNSLSMLEFEKDNIRSILLNDRKLKLLKELEKNAMKDAELNNVVEKYMK